MSDENLSIDVSADPCPMSFVRAKLTLEEVEVGERITVTMRGGEACNNVPRSFESEGHHVIELVPTDETEQTWRLVVERGK